MLKIGLTGGIGSGKSTVAAVFEFMGIPVYYADEVAKRLMNDDPLLTASIREIFGEDSYQNGQLNKAYLRSQIFSDASKREKLNQLVHPVTIQDARDWMDRQTTPYAIKEAALIFESGAEKDLDYILGIFAPPNIRLQRIMHRDHISVEEAGQRIAAQMNEEEKMKLCDFVICNDEKQSIITQVVALDKLLLSKTKSCP